MKGHLIRADGSEAEVVPKDGKEFTLEELQAFVGGTVDVQVLPDGTAIYLNDNGKLNELPRNEKATEMWKQAYPIEVYPHNNDELIVGDVMVLSAEDQRKMEEVE